MKTLLTFLFSFFLVSFTIYSQPLTLSYNPNTGIVSANYDIDADPNIQYDYNCLDQCELDEYYDGRPYSQCAPGCRDFNFDIKWIRGYYAVTPNVDATTTGSGPLVQKLYQGGVSQSEYYSLNLSNYANGSFLANEWTNGSGSVCFRVDYLVETNGTTNSYNATICRD